MSNKKPSSQWLNTPAADTIGNVVLALVFATICILFAYSALTGAEMVARPAF